MSAIKKSVRLTAPTIEALRPFSDAAGEGMNWSGSINAMAEHMKIFLDETTPHFTDKQWHAFYCMYNGYFPHPDIKEEARLLPWHVSEAWQYDEQVKEFIGPDIAGFLAVVKLCSLTQRLCIIYKAKQYWRKNRPLVDSPFQDE